MAWDIAVAAAPPGVRSATAASHCGNSARGYHMPAKNHMSAANTLPIPAAAFGLRTTEASSTPSATNASRLSTAASANSPIPCGSPAPNSAGITTIRSATTSPTTETIVNSAASRDPGELGVVRSRRSTPISR